MTHIPKVAAVLMTQWVISTIAHLLNRQLSYKHEIIVVGSHANKKSLGLYVNDGEVQVFPFQQYRAAGRFEVEEKESLQSFQVGDDDDTLGQLAQDIAQEAHSLGTVDSIMQVFESYKSKCRPPSAGAKITKINHYIVTSRRPDPFTDPSHGEQISLGVLRLLEEQIPRYGDRQCILVNVNRPAEDILAVIMQAMGTFILHLRLLFGVGLNAHLPLTRPLAQRGRLPFGSHLSGPFGAHVLAITPGKVLKVKRGLHASEAAVTKFVHDSTNCPAPDVFDVAQYGERVGIIMSRMQGVSLSSLWEEMDPTDKGDIVNQLKAIIRDFRSHESPYIGRPGRQSAVLPMGLSSIAFGPFDREEDFNEFRLSQTRSLDEKLIANATALQNSGHRFVLTHGDLSDRNIMVFNGKITAIIDWEYGGWYPEYWEYVAAKFNGGHSGIWRKVLDEVLEDRYDDMVELEQILRSL